MEQNQNKGNLKTVIEIFNLSETELEILLGTDCQTIKQMANLSNDKLSHLAKTAQTIKNTFRSEEIPRIVRESLPGLKGKTILETLASENGSEEVACLLERLKSYVPIG